MRDVADFSITKPAFRTQLAHNVVQRSYITLYGGYERSKDVEKQRCVPAR